VRILVSRLTIVVMALLCAVAAHAQDYPKRSITMIVPFAAGGTSDVIARVVAEEMTKSLGQPIVIENVAGAGGSTGASRVAKAAPDGYVFLYGNSGTHTYSQLLTKKPPYNAITDFAPVAVFVENSKVLVTRKDFPADTLPDFVPTPKATRAGCNSDRPGRARPHI
jgi:tripartite-type tricarboxylate transporter receptor subunit TctC